jgi:hypothetical protein
VAFLRIALLLAAAVTAGCFSPRQPPCAFSCADDGLCPTGYSCHADGVCHRDDGPDTCDIASQTDAGADGSNASDSSDDTTDAS